MKGINCWNLRFTFSGASAKSAFALLPTSIVSPANMKVAVEGCCHGELDAIYSHIAHLEQKNGYTIDVLLICGDFQAIRNERDLQCMAVPDKYRKLGEFYK